MTLKTWKILAGPLLGILVYFIFPHIDPTPFIPDNFKGTLPDNLAGSNLIAKVAAITVWVAFWWITEAVNIYFTALLPVFLFPFFGVIPMRDVAPLFMKDVIFLFVGGFLIAFGIERWNLHKRIALKIILLVGVTPERILFGFMFAGYFLSMWIMNTATVTLLLPAVLAVVSQVENFTGKKNSSLATVFLLGLAYASSIGGMATLIGTAPNLILMDFVNTRLPDIDISFANWFMMGFPISLVLFAVCFATLRLLYHKAFRQEAMSVEFCRREYNALGKVTYEQRVVSVIFLLTVFLWFFMKDITIGSFTIHGWASMLPEPSYVKESTVAITMGCVLYLFPSKAGKGGLILWEDIQRIPLGIIFLFGGGFALAKGFELSGFSNYLAGHMAVVKVLPDFAIILILCLFMTFLTELTSNTASTLLVLPIIFSFSGSLNVHPLLVLITVTLSASCAFMLPVATPPNTIVFSSEKIAIKDMMRTGIYLNFICAVIISIAAFTIIKFAYGL